jgi:hypothetical protein
MPFDTARLPVRRRAHASGSESDRILFRRLQSADTNGCWYSGFSKVFAFMANTFISLRDRLTGAVVDLLNDEHMPCVHTQDGLVTIVNALSL